MAITLDTAVTDYLTAVTTSLTVGSDLGSSMRAAALNYLRAQDMSTVLELLQEALTTAPMTVVSGSTTTIVDGAATFTAGAEVGNTVTMLTGSAGNVGFSARVTGNTTTTLTFAPALPVVTAVGDTYSLSMDVASSAIAALRQGTNRGDSTGGSVYGDNTVAYNGMLNIIEKLGHTSATLTALQARVAQQILVHPGAQPGENAVLASWISETQLAVEGFTLPT